MELNSGVQHSVISQNEDILRRLLNLEVDFNNLKHTMLNVLQEHELIRAKTGVYRNDSLQQKIKQLVEEEIDKKFSPKFESLMILIQNKFAELAEHYTNKSPFDIQVLK